MSEPIGLFSKSKVTVDIVVNHVDGTTEYLPGDTYGVGRFRTMLLRLRMWFVDRLNRRAR